MEGCCRNEMAQYECKRLCFWVQISQPLTVVLTTAMNLSQWEEHVNMSHKVSPLTVNKLLVTMGWELQGWTHYDSGRKQFYWHSQWGLRELTWMHKATMAGCGHRQFYWNSQGDNCWRQWSLAEQERMAVFHQNPQKWTSRSGNEQNCLAWGSHAVLAYSARGLTSDL